MRVYWFSLQLDSHIVITPSHYEYMGHANDGIKLLCTIHSNKQQVPIEMGKGRTPRFILLTLPLYYDSQLRPEKK